MRHESGRDGECDLPACGKRAGLSCSWLGAGLRQDKMAVYKLLVGCGIFVRRPRRGLVHVLPINCVILHPRDALARAPAVLHQEARMQSSAASRVVAAAHIFFSVQIPGGVFGAGRKSLLLLTWREAFWVDVAVSRTNNPRTCAEWQDCTDRP